MQLPSGLERRFVQDTAYRGVFTRRQFAKGEHLFTDEPLVIQADGPVPYAHCDWCARFLGPFESLLRLLADAVAWPLPTYDGEVFRTFVPELVTPVVCDRCEVQYCSVACRDAASRNYHKLLCGTPILSKVRAAENSRALKYTMVVKLLAGILLRVDDKVTVTEECNRLLSAFHAPRFSTIFAFKARCKEEEIDCAEFIQPLRSCLPATFDCFNDIFINQVIGMLISNCRTEPLFSPLHVFYKKLERDIEKKSHDAFILYKQFLPLCVSLNASFDGIPRIDASCLGVLYSMLNHSCVPNVAGNLTEEQHMLNAAQADVRHAFVATIPLPAGTQLTVSYISAAAPHFERRTELRSQYLFECICKLCLQDMQNSCASCGKQAALRCSRCKKPFYCSQTCQTQDWPMHKRFCSAKG